MKASRFFVLSVAALFAACTVSLLHAEEEEANGAAASPSTSEAAPAYLGVLLGPVPDALAAHLEVEGGALLAQVVPGSPAAQAGLARYDVIVKAGGREVDSPDALAAWIRERTAGTEVELEARRGREVVHARVTLGELTRDPGEPVEFIDPDTQDGASAPQSETEATRPGFLGVRFEPVPPLLARHVGVAENAAVVVGEVLPDSAAAKAGLEAGDLLLRVGEKAITFDTVRDVLADYHEGDTVQLTVMQRGEEKGVEVVLGARPAHLSTRFGGHGFDELHPFGKPPGDGYQFWNPPLRGRLHLRGENGQEDTFEWNGGPKGFSDRMLEDFRRRFESRPWLRDHTEDLERRLSRMLEKFRNEFEDVNLGFDFSVDLGPGFGSDVERSMSFSQTGEVRMIDGGYEIVLRNDNGKRTVSVKKNGEALATDLPVEQVDELPAGARERVERFLKQSRWVERGGFDFDAPPATTDDAEPEASGPRV